MRRFAGIVLLPTTALLLLSTPASMFSRGASHHTNSTRTLDFLNLVALTGDYVNGPLHSGCDAISLHDYQTGAVIDHGLKHISPARIAASIDSSVFVANPSNSCGRTDDAMSETLNPECTGWLSMRRPHASNPDLFVDGFYSNLNLVYKGGLAMTSGTDLLVATSGGGRMRSLSMIPGPPFGVARYRLPDTLVEDGRMRPPLATLTVNGIVGEILPVQQDSRAILVTTNGTVMTVDSDSLNQLGPPVAYPTAVSLRHRYSETQPPLEGFHATALESGDTVVVSRMFAGDIAIISVSAGTSITQSVGASEGYVGGVALNNGWINPGLLAVHAIDQVLVLEIATNGNVIQLGALAINPPDISYRDVTNEEHGPQFSIAWTTDGSHLIAAQGGSEDFGVTISPTTSGPPTA